MSECFYRVERADTVTSVEEYLSGYIDVSRFLACCEQCSNYGRRWACPPFDFGPMKLWRCYETLHLYACILIPENRDGEALIGALMREKEKFLDELLALEKRTPGSLALSCGSCGSCSVCRRQEGLPCCHPERLRSSIEALGGDVAKTARHYFGKPLLWVKDGIAPDYLMLVGGLLLREELPCK